MRRLRYWLCSQLLELARKAHPNTSNTIAYPPDTKVWQIIQVPRRITEGEALRIAEQVRNL